MITSNAAGKDIPDAITDLLSKGDTTKFEDSFAEENWRNTYKDHKDETVNDSLKRIAIAIASVEDTEEKKSEWAVKFYSLLTNFKGVPGGRTFSNAGTEWSGTTLMNCFVGPRGKYDIDSIEGIYNHLLQQSQTLKSEGGWGENFSYIRPRGSFIAGIGIESPGSVKYMELFDKASEIITSGSGKKAINKQGKNKVRKGAMMGVLDTWHPDIIEFITAKQQPGRLTKFNISVNVSDEFMERVNKIKELDVLLEGYTGNPYDVTKQNLVDEYNRQDEWELIFPDTTYHKYRKEWNGDISQWKVKGYPIKVHNTVSVKWLWNLIMESTYNRAEPGVLFLDRANQFNPFYYGETIFATNPCGEQTLSPGNICCLGSLNLTQFVDGDRFNIPLIKQYTQYMVRFLDNVNSYSSAPLPEYEDSMRKKRRIGLGVMGWGSSLFMLKVRFGSESAAQLREELMTTIARTAYETSIDLAEEKGMFAYCKPEKHAEGAFIKQLGLSEEYMEKLRKVGIRNASLMSQQPTGNCQTLDAIIQTIEYGDISYRDIIEKQFGKIEIEKLIDGQTLILKTPIHVKTFEGNDLVEQIFINGFSQTTTLILEDDFKSTQTLNHKYLVKIDDDTAEWVESKDLKSGMKILAI